MRSKQSLATETKFCRPAGSSLMRALLSGCALTLFAPSVSLAGDITIPSGTTVTTTQTLTDVGDTGTVDSGGTIDVTDEDGLVLANDDQTTLNNGDIFVERTGGTDLAAIGSLGANSTITNNGTISMTGDEIIGIVTVDDGAVIVNTGTVQGVGDLSVGIFTQGNSSSVLNTGTIEVTGDFGSGIEVDGDNSTVVNNGNVVTNGIVSDAIYVFGDNVSVTNNGTLDASGVFAFGIYSEGASSTLVNNQTITTSGDSGFGIGADGDDTSITNAGTITTTGDDSDGINASGDDSTVTNSGTITTTGDDAHGIDADGDNAVVVNSGTIITTGDGSTGIDSDSSSGTSISNTGTINVAGDGALGIESEGDDSTVTNSGTIVTMGDVAPGIGITGTGSTASNSGSITTTGEGSAGLGSLGDDTTLINSGAITTTADNSSGFFVNADNVTAINSGTIVTSGDGAFGIDSEGDGNRVTNSGTITTTGDDADGFDSDGDDVTLINSGVISLSGTEADGIDNDGDNATILNSGTIRVSGEDSNGIESTGAATMVTNSGTINNTGPVSGLDDDVGHGISIVGNDAIVINSGEIFSSNGSSIYIDGSDAIVTLQDGTVLQGLLTFTDPTTATLNYSANRTAILTFSGFPGTLSTGGLVSSTNGSTITILNPDDFKLGTTSFTFNALTRSYTGSLEDQMDANRQGTSASVATNGGPAVDLSDRNSLWAVPMGGVLDRQGNDGYNHAYGGIMAGADRILAPDFRAGVTAGFSLGRTESNDDIHTADSYSIFGGAYLAKDWQATFAQVSLLGGYLKSDEDVTILNNMVVGGLQDLSIDYDYLYLSPSARLGHAIPLAGGTLTSSARIRYSGLWQTGDANENTTGFAVSGRSLHILEVRAETSYDFAPKVHETGTLFVSMNAGVDGIFTLDDKLDASFTGTALNLSTDSDTVVRGFASANAVWQAENGLKFLAGIEGGYDSEDTLSAALRLGAKINF
ncbi:autotransporter outer membrane beta-barrel domain-containing protein [Roseibium sp. M-1]